MENSPVSDAALRDDLLLARMHAGNGDAFAAFYNRYADRSIRLAFTIVGDLTAAEDIFQGVFIKVWRNPSLYDRHLGSVRTWVSAMIRNAAIDYRRRLEARMRYQRNSSFHRSTWHDPAVMADLRADALAVKNAISALPEAHKQVLELAYFEGLTQQDIACRIDKSLGTVKTWTRLGLLKLREAIIS